MKLKPRPYQAQAVDALFSTLKRDKSSSPVIVLPTGAGKSVVAAMINERLAQHGMRTVTLCRTKELVEQNFNALRRLSPHLHCSLYCSGLGKKDPSGAFVFATAQSVARNPEVLGSRNLVLVDEAHQVPARDGSQYQQIMAGLAGINPAVRLAGMTATPYRLDGGPIAGDGKQFSEIAFSRSLVEMVDDGWLVPTVESLVDSVDLSEVPTIGGDYSDHELGHVFGERCIQHAWEIVDVAKQKGRGSCLVFASTVEHARALANEIWRRDKSVDLVTGSMAAAKRDAAIAGFKEGKTRFLVNVGVLTTGFDAPCVDMIALCRATQSHSLLYQILGRGMRLCDGKQDCLVLDYGDHESRLGSIYDEGFGLRDEPQGEQEKKERDEDSRFTVDRKCSHCQHERQLPEVQSALKNAADELGKADPVAWASHWLDAIENEPAYAIPNDIRQILSRCPNCGKPYTAQLLESLSAQAKAAGNKEPVVMEVMSYSVVVDRRSGSSSFAKIIFTGTIGGKVKTVNSYLHFSGSHAVETMKSRWAVLYPGVDAPESAEQAASYGKIGNESGVSEAIIYSTGRFEQLYIDGVRF